MGGAMLMVLIEAVSIDDLLQSFSNRSVITIFLLIFITSIVHKHFNLVALLDKTFKTAKSPKAFVFQMTAGVSALSSVMNNTPIVALFIPYVYQWAKKNNVAPSRLLIPLSYAAIFGGMITVIGTSTNLVLNGFLLERGKNTLNFIDFLLPGVGVSLAGVLFLGFFSHKLLPNKKTLGGNTKQQFRDYLAETYLSSPSPIIGKSVQQAGLRNLDGVFLAEILRGEHWIRSVSSEEMLLDGDRLFFAGDVAKVMEVVKRFEGLSWSKTEKFNLVNETEIVESVIPANSIVEGKTLKEISFRDRFDAAVIGVHRNGEKLSGKLGEIKLNAGDLLLLTTGPRFKSIVSKGKDLYTLSILEEKSKSSVFQRKLFLLAMTALILLSIFNVLSFFMALMLITASAVVLRLFNSSDLKRQTNLDLLLILGGAITVGKAFIDSGAAELLVHPMIEWIAPFGPIAVVVGLYFLTLIFTSFITNVAAVSILFPIAWQLCHDLGLNPTVVYLVLAFGASASFLTPVSYQTNLMVYGPGGYNFKDFIKIGIPFTFLYSIVALYLILQFNSLYAG